MALPASDDFAGSSDYTALSARTNWTSAGGLLSTFSAHVYCGSGSQSCCYWDADTFSDAQSSEIDIFAVRQYYLMGVAVFVAPSSDDYYAFYGDSDNSYIDEIVSGVGSTLVGGLTALATNDTVKLTTSVSGGTTTLEAFINDVSETSTTDTTRTSGSAGIAAISDSGDAYGMDNWVGGDIAAAGTTGTLNVTEADDTSTATANTEYIGTADNTEANDTSTATANTEYIGTLNVTEANDTVTGAGNVATAAVTGTADNTEKNDTSTTAGTVANIGTLNVTEADDTSTATANTEYIGILNVTEENDTSIGTGNLTSIGTLNVTEADDTIIANVIAGEDISGTADNVVDNDILTGVVTLTSIGIADNTEANDTSTTVGTIANIGTLNVTEDDDIPSIILLQGIGILGLVNTIDDNDTLSASVYAPPEHTALVYDITQIIDRTTTTYIANFENIEILTDTTSDAVDIILTNSNSTVEIR